MAAAGPLTTDAVVEVLARDHSQSMTKGHLRALMHRPGAPGFLRDLYDLPRRQPVQTTAPPSRTAATPRPPGAQPRDLTVGEATWLASLPTDPREISDADARALASLAGEVRTQGERRLVASRFDGVRALDEASRRLYAAERELATMPMPQDPTRLPCWDEARRWLGEQARREIPELEPAEAEARATRLVTEAWKPNTGRRNDLRAEIGDLSRTHGIEGTVFDGTPKWGVTGDDNQTRLRETDDTAAAA